MKLTKHRQKTLFGTVALLALASAMPSSAQEADQPEDGTKRLGEITVTATRREASIQDVPIAVSAFDTETLDRQGVVDLKSLDSLSSSFSIQSAQVPTQATSIRIRGVGTTGNNIGLESAVGVFLDGVYLARPGIALGDLVDLEQIEVLRGPQGTLFGRNTSAGALNITTSKPNLQEFEGFANVTVGNLETYGVQGGFSVPLIKDQLGLRLSGSYREQEGILASTADNLDGSDIESNNTDRWQLRGQVLWEPTSDITVRLIGDYAETDENCCDAVLLQDGIGDLGIFGTLGPVPSTGLVDPTGGAPVSGPDALDDRISNGEEFASEVEQWGISGQLDWDLGFANLTYIGAYRDFFGGFVQESDFVGLDIFSGGGVTAVPGVSDQPSFDDIQSQTHEVRFQGEAFDGRLDWLVGGFYSNEDILENFVIAFGDDFDLNLGALFGGAAGPSPIQDLLSAPDPFANFLFATQGIAGPTLAPGIDPSGSFAANQFEQQSRSWSIFTHNTFAVTDQLDFTVGLRWVDERKDGTFRQLDASSPACNAIANNLVAGNLDFLDALAPGAGAIAAGVTCFPFATEANLPGSGVPGGLFTPATFSDDANEPGVFVEDFEDDELVYTLKASYAVTDDINVYGGFTHGFKAGGFNLDSTAASLGADPRFDSEEIDAWELGVKADLLDGRARVNAAFFHQDLSNFQVLEFTGVQFQTFNVDEALSTGVEIEAQFQATDQLTLTAAMTYANARYPDDCAPQDPADENFLVNAANLCGNDLTNAPEFVGIWGATWEDDFRAFGQDLTYFGNVNVRYSTDRRTATQATLIANGETTDTPFAFDIQDAVTKLNLRFGIGSVNELWQLEVFANNLTDEVTQSITFNVPLRVNPANTVPGGGQTIGSFVEAPRTYGLTLRTKF